MSGSGKSLNSDIVAITNFKDIYIIDVINELSVLL